MGDWWFDESVPVGPKVDPIWYADGPLQIMKIYPVPTDRSRWPVINTPLIVPYEENEVRLGTVIEVEHVVEIVGGKKYLSITYQPESKIEMDD